MTCLRVSVSPCLRVSVSPCLRVSPSPRPRLPSNMTSDAHPRHPNAPSPVMLRAAWVAPMDGPPVRDGGVVMAGGRVAAVGDGRALAGRFPEATVHDAGEAIVLPG